MSVYSFILKDSNEVIYKMMVTALIKKLQGSFYNYKNLQGIQNIVGSYVKKIIQNTPTWQSLLGSDPEGLDAHLGLNSNTRHERLNRLLDIWINEIEVRPRTIQKTQQRFVFAYDFYAIRADFANVLGSDEALVHNISKNSNEGKTPKIIPWLHWLLISGDNVEIDGYHFHPGNFAESRSGKALMYAKASWKMPGDFGPYNIDNNFITRALKDIASDDNFKDRLGNILQSISSNPTYNIDSSFFDESII